MGEVISKKAARDRIIDDAQSTLDAAKARAAAPGGAVWAVAEPRLSGVLTLYRTTRGKSEAARAEFAPLAAALDVANDTADDVVKAQSELLWNELGRPANDPVFELLFPGGSGFYVDASVEDQPQMMLLLAELLESNLSAKLAANAAPKATAIRDAAARLSAAVDAARKPRATVKLYDRMLTAVARSAQLELSRLKRYWKSEGLSEADIHTVIPDRPRNYGVPAPQDPSTPVAPDPIDA